MCSYVTAVSGPEYVPVDVLWDDTTWDAENFHLRRAVESFLISRLANEIKFRPEYRHLRAWRARPAHPVLQEDEVVPSRIQRTANDARQIDQPYRSCVMVRNQT
jgi:hypothetical protein